MKSNSTRLLQILSKKNLSFFVLVELDWNEPHYFTDFGGDLVWNGNVYSSNNPLVSSQSIQYSNVVDRESFSFTLSGLDEEMVSEVKSGILNRSVKFRMVFAEAGVPLLGVNDTLLFYEGAVAGSSVLMSQETKEITIECTAPLSNLDEKGTLYTTSDGISGMDPTDTSFDNVQEGSEETSLKWGKT